MAEDTEQSELPEQNEGPEGISFPPKSPEAKRIWVLIWIVFGVVLALNGWVFYLHSAEYDTLGYFESSAFKALLASLLIPLVMSAISRAFKIDERIEVDRKLAEQEKRRRQLQAIQKTNEMWSELYSLSTEIAYFEKGRHSKNVRDIRKRLECYISSAEEVVNLWYLNFPNIPTEVPDLFLPGVNLLLLSAMTVADVVEDEEADAKNLQNCLLVIQDGVRSGLHYSIIQIFYFAMEGRDADLQKQIATLRNWGELFKQMIKDLPPNFPPGDDAGRINERRNKFQYAWAQYSKSKAAHSQLEEKAGKAPDAASKKQILDSAEYAAALKTLDAANQTFGQVWGEYKGAILETPPTVLGLARKRLFSHDQIRQFTREMFFQNDRINIQTGV